jgi:hypothetical protein
MFCHDFEKISGDLAAGRLMEAGKRERALRHASECFACALRLNAERTLEAGLRALGEGVEDRGAPPHLKTALRAAFDRQVDAVHVLSPAPARSRYSTLRWLAAAALILIAFAVAFLFRTAPSNSIRDTVSSEENRGRREQPPQRVTETENQKRKIETNIARKTPTGRRANRRTGASDDMARNNETVTDYIPLTYLADATAVESGTVLRVELPPSALVTMGLPAPVDRTGSRFKADVVIGDDGVPRAVRFVGQDSVRR